jgi:hypothetical protein
MEDYLAVERVQREKTAGMRIRAHLDTAVKPSIRDWSINVAVDVVSGLALALTGSGGPG